MNLEQLLAMLEEKKIEAKILDKKQDVTIEELEKINNEIDVLNKKIEIASKIKDDEEDEKPNNPSNFIPVEDKENTKKDLNDQYSNIFYKAIKGGVLNQEELEVVNEVNSDFKNALSSTTDADGGFLIPVDQRVAIKELKRQFVSIEPYINVEPVTTLTGSRNIEKEAEYTPFTTFAEGDDVPASDSPQFENVTYSITDKGGILPVPNNLFSDNGANLKPYLNRWLAKKEVATINSATFTLLATISKTAIAGIDDIKKVFNITLDPSISAMSIVVTNQTGFNWLDTQKDTDGKYILQPNPVDKTKRMLFGIHEVIVFSDKILKNDTTSGVKAPLIMGSLKEGVTRFDRQAMSLLATQIGGDAFIKNKTNIRAIIRDDFKKVDKKSVAYGQITI